MINQQREMLEKMKFACLSDAYRFYVKLKRVNQTIIPENEQHDSRKELKLCANQNR